MFHLYGIINRDISHYWRLNSHQQTSEEVTTPFDCLASDHSLTVSSDLSSLDRDTMNSERCLEVLEDTLVPSLRTIDRYHIKT